jgi:CBS domain-containing protein
MNIGREITIVKEIMTLNPECITPDTTIKNAAIKMKDINSGFLPICENDRLAGVITDRDIVIRGIANGINVDSTVRDIMTEKVVYCYDDATLKEVAHKMEDEFIRRLIVLNRNKRLVGILSIDDIASRADVKSLTGEILKLINEKLINM